MKKFFSDFKKFISRGNIVDMSVGVIIGSAFSAIVTSLTNKIIMPFINWLLSLGGTNGLESAYTFLKKVYAEDGVTVDLAKSIYIDWGAFITAILNFFLIALVLFMILKVMMKAKGFWGKAVKANPTRAERKELRAQGVNMKDWGEVLKATEALRKSKEPVPAPPKPTQEQLLSEILTELKKQNEEKVVVEKVEEVKSEAEENVSEKETKKSAPKAKKPRKSKKEEA